MGIAVRLLLAVLAFAAVGSVLGAAQVGRPAPGFVAEAVKDKKFIDIKLEEYQRDGKYVVLFFYPLDFTFVCPTEITAFSDAYDEFNNRNTEILGVSVDSKFSHLAWLNTPRDSGGVEGLKYPLVSDLGKTIAADYGVLTPDGVALRGLFVIDPKGVIQHATINNLGFGRSVDETLRVLQAIQHIQTHPDEVCPAGWKPGGRTMVPTPTGSLSYFSAATGEDL
ncbi:unnamed protein product [Pedinophyceae sp. YPF-701]|nr:unnamed protein product [Pedinophyceae sp. YPF-701]